MYAVEKIGNYISRGVYTVSGPFHPFGGAVDIIVVQQQDGSFKSSPWYVRFGKFQGVLKTKEKLVKISVNGVEAGFNMYLDHKGEAFFLRDAEAGGQDFVISPPTSGDETEEKTKDGRLEKMKSFDVESRQQMIAQVDNGNGKLISRTSSRRSTIFGLVFGRKSFKGNNKFGNVERVSSLERAEIAADLLEVKWSTNRSCSDRVDPKVKLSDKSEMNVRAADEEGPQTLLPEVSLHVNEQQNPSGERMGDSYVKSIPSRDSSEEARVASGLTASNETLEMYISETGDNTTPDQKSAELVFGNSVVDSKICNFDFDATFDHSFVSDVEGLGDTHRNSMLTEKNFEEITSHEEVLKIHTLEISDKDDGNILMSELATVQTNETDLQIPASPASCGDEAESCTKGHVVSIPDISTLETGEKINSFGYSQTIESSTVQLNISDEKSFEHPGFFPHVSELSDITNNIVPEVSSPSLSVPSQGKEISDDCHVWSLETNNDSKPYVSSISHDDLTSGAFEISDNSGFYTEVDPSSSSDHISSGISFSSNQQSLSCGYEGLSMHVFEEESALAIETDVERIDFIGCPAQMEEIDGAQAPLFPASIHSSPLDIGAPTELHAVSGFLDSCNSNSAVHEIGSFDIGDNLERSYSIEINAAQVCHTVSVPTEVAEHSVPCSESSEEVQFLFSDIDNFGAKEIDTELTDNCKISETQHPQIVTSECDLEEQDFQNKNDKLHPGEESIVFRSHSSPIRIPDSVTSSGENQLSCRSLPVVRSHIKDLEGSDFHHSLSFPLVERAGIAKVDDAVISPSNEEQPKDNLASSTIELSLCKHLLFEGMGEVAAREVFNAEKVDLQNFTALGPSVVKNDRLVVRIGDRYFPWDTAAPIVLGMICFGQQNIFEPQGMIDVDGAERKFGSSRSIPSRGSWNLWPFMKRSKTISNVHETSEGNEEISGDSAANSTENIVQESDMLKSKNYKKVQSLTPTSEELASLNLEEGLNVVKFSYSTKVLGLQQVDARIYLWKWNTQIVISDVDGTITKSDVLGQFMPLVGVDWSQTGVAHLFSAIKDNGYQLLFLSARAISQAHLTRQFLFNLKQDGKALPDGPVVISPDGLFPSLFREVIRRAPHEFKISCLEVIKALFPPDCNPFYAGFGNRDTDEISYLKVGIPIGKIFIINPKGQVAVNRRVDTKSYTSLHELVNGIFPPMSSFEREDYNGWNYWKLPLPEIDV